MSYDEDVRFVGAFLRGGDWEVGLRIARNVAVPEKQGAHVRSDMKVSLEQFATDAGFKSKTTVAKYLAAWIWAAKDGIVPASETLSADDEFDFEGMDWHSYYEQACENPPPWSTTAIAPMEGRKPPGRHVGRKTIIEGIKADPTLVSEAVKADPNVAVHAREAISERDAKAASAKGKDSKGKQSSPMEQFTSLHIQLRSAKRALTEALGYVIDIRGVTDTDETRAAVAGYVQQIRHVLDLIDEAAQGKSLDDELAELLADEEL